MLDLKIIDTPYTKYKDYITISDCIRNPSDCDGYFNTYGCFSLTSEDVAESMDFIYNQKQLSDETNRLFHIIAYFEDNEENTPEQLSRIAMFTAEKIGKDYQSFFGIHHKRYMLESSIDDSHIHFMINSVEYSSLEEVENTEANRLKLLERFKEIIIEAEKYDYKDW